MESITLFTALKRFSSYNLWASSSRFPASLLSLSQPAGSKSNKTQQIFKIFIIKTKLGITSAKVAQNLQSHTTPSGKPYIKTVSRPAPPPAAANRFFLQHINGVCPEEQFLLQALFYGGSVSPAAKPLQRFITAGKRGGTGKNARKRQRETSSGRTTSLST
jgi:hypothetical protein